MDREKIIDTIKTMDEMQVAFLAKYYKMGLSVYWHDSNGQTDLDDYVANGGTRELRFFGKKVLEEEISFLHRRSNSQFKDDMMEEYDSHRLTLAVIFVSGTDCNNYTKDDLSNAIAEVEDIFEKEFDMPFVTKIECQDLDDFISSGHTLKECNDIAKKVIEDSKTTEHSQTLDELIFSHSNPSEDEMEGQEESPEEIEM